MANLGVRMGEGVTRLEDRGDNLSENKEDGVEGYWEIGERDDQVERRGEEIRREG